MQANGYKPAPLDLSAIELTPKMEELVCILLFHFFVSYFLFLYLTFYFLCLSF